MAHPITTVLDRAIALDRAADRDPSAADSATMLASQVYSDVFSTADAATAATLAEIAVGLPHDSNLWAGYWNADGYWVG